MRLHAREARRAGGGLVLNMAPLIDVVFLLLMYFMVATDFSPAEEVFRLDLPASVVGSQPDPPDPLDLLEEPLRVRLTAAGSSGQAVRVQVEGPWDVTPSIKGLGDFLAGSVIPQGTLLVAEHPIIIDPTPSVSWEHVVAAFNAAVAAGCTNVTLETAS
ncbi:MAG: biopolymer transporter ExbD [Phycisphaerales bacterium]|jgi:hypothetical protein|nr:biopolymer transporter ExbD [Phycisphaerales bacterium]